MTPSCLPRRADSEHVLCDLIFLTRSGHVRPMSDQGQFATEVGQYAHLPKRLDQPSRLAPFARRFYLNPVASYWRKPNFDLI